MGTTYTAAKPDVLVAANAATSGFVTSWGTALCLAPVAGNQRSVANRDETVYSNVGSAYVADPSGVVDKYNKRFNEKNYY
jgi:hypothetical protein